MKSLVIKPFIDKDTQTGYSEGDMYESVDSKRIAFLQEERFLKLIQDNSDEPQHVGGGYYQLPNGEKIKGKETALKALKELKQVGE